MGKEVEAVANEFGFTVIGGTGRATAGIDAALAELAQAGQKPDVVIDFSLPIATAEVAKACAKHGVPLVSGVTGLDDAHMTALRKAAETIPVLYSANMSIGIQMLAKALEALKGVDGFDLAIEDIHHRHKRDHPSGTALLLNKELQKRTGREAGEIVSLRGGGVIGIHRVLALSESETLTFEHSALNRGVFARGACRAARWIHGRAPGFHGLGDLFFG
jgi:4-hydroxy-tetrahydrodipicolinate reductase